MHKGNYARIPLNIVLSMLAHEYARPHSPLTYR